MNSGLKQGAFILSRKEKAFVWTQQSGIKKIQKYAWPKFSASFSVNKLVVKEFFLLSLKLVLYDFRYAPLPYGTKDLFFSVYNRIHASVVNSFEHYEEWHRELCPLERGNGGKQKMLIIKLHGSESVWPYCRINSVQYLSKSNISAQSHYAAKLRLLLDNFSNEFNCAW